MKQNQVQVSGPISWIKLSDGKKVVYLFGEFHVNWDECQYPFDHFDTFLKNQFDNTTKPIDFFLETFHKGSYHVGNSRNPSSKTINKIRKYFAYVNESGVYKHKQHRLHYFDFREELNLTKCWRCYENISIYDYEICSDNLYWLNELKGAVYEYSQQFDKPNDTKFFQKLLHKHTNEQLKKEINELFANISKQCKTFINILSKFIDNYKIFINNINFGKLTSTLRYWKTDCILSANFLLQKLEEQWDDVLRNLMSFVGCSIIDIYVIRRLLDKDYINNCILYAGFYHTNHITYLLIKKFNFRVVDQDKHINASKLESDVSKMSYDDFIAKGGIAEMYPEFFTQCVICPKLLF